MIRVKGNSILVWRVGPVSARKQAHWGTDHHQPARKRGLWVFPYTKHDRFFVYPTQVEAMLPKEYQADGGSHPEEWWIKREALVKEIVKRAGQSVWWHTGGFWSHVFPSGNSNYSTWYWWDSPKDWLQVAQKGIFTFHRAGNEVFRLNYSSDHLELFLEEP